jgi:DNA-binding winged helix-turn-helix (wHTH) protein/tetratricopeptide (TPR) repeat protein
VSPDYRFGFFEVFASDGVLLYQGRRVKIQELPFRMLVVLLERPGKMVSREELIKRLWSQTNYADADNNLHTVAVKLRGALRDDANAPSFIETVPKRGYRFIGELRPISPVPPGDEPTSQSARETSPIHPADSRKGHWLPQFRGVLALAVAVAGVAAAGSAIYTHRPVASSEDKVVLGEFLNSTGDPDFDKMLSPALRVKLQESPYLSLLPDRRFLAHLARTPNSTPLANELQACNSADAQILLRGQILAKGSGYQVLLTAWKCSSGRQLSTQKADANSRAAILPALDMATMEMRRGLGESDSSLQRFNVPVEQATTSSFAALKAYTQGTEKVAEGHGADSVADFKLAVDLDPQFALAYAQLAGIYYNTGQLSLSRQYFQKAFTLRERTTDRERLIITTLYYGFATGEILRAIQAYELWRTIYPGDLAPANDLASAYVTLGQPEKAVEPALAAIHLDPTLDAPYATLAQAYLSSGDFAGATKLCADPAREKTTTMQFHEFCFVLAYVQNDGAAMQRQLNWARGNPGESVLLETSAWISMYQGKLGESRAQFAGAKRNALTNGLNESGALIALDQAGLEADLGFTQEAKKAALEALKLSPDSATVQASAALVLARTGDISNAEDEAKKANAQAPQDTILNSAALACVQAAIDLQRHDPEAALQALGKTRPFDFNIVTALAPAYYRGLAYLQANQPQEAAKEFQRILDHRNVMPYSLYVSLSQLELGRALQLSGDSAAASLAYDEAANLWKDADADFPPLRQLNTYQHQLAAEKSP